MFCSFCGKELVDGVNFCSSCGQPLPRAEHAADPAATPGQVAPPAVKSAPRMSAAGVVWCAICLAANLALAILGIVALSAQRGGNAAGIVAIIATFVAAFGFVMLLFANREGLYVLCLAALVGVVTNFAVGSWINALFGVLNPVITWLFIRNSWEKMGQPFETPRSRRTALILASIPYTGWFGLDRLYLGYGWLGFLKAITCGGMLVWYVLDIVKLARNRMRDGFDQPLCWRSGSPSPIQRAQSKGKALRVWGIVLISMGLVVGINGVVQVSFGGSYKSVGDFITGPILFIGVGIFLLLRGLKRAAQHALEELDVPLPVQKQEEPGMHADKKETHMWMDSGAAKPVRFRDMGREEGVAYVSKMNATELMELILFGEDGQDAEDLVWLCSRLTAKMMVAHEVNNRAVIEMFFHVFGGAGALAQYRSITGFWNPNEAERAFTQLMLRFAGLPKSTRDVHKNLYAENYRER